MKLSILGLAVAAIIVACGQSDVQFRGAQYATSLEECNRKATTLCESIECENWWRRHNVREERPVPKHCLKNDGGTSDASTY